MPVESSFAEELSLTAQRDSLLQELNNIKDHLRLRGHSLDLEPVVMSRCVVWRMYCCYNTCLGIR